MLYASDLLMARFFNLSRSEDTVHDAIHSKSFKGIVDLLEIDAPDLIETTTATCEAHEEHFVEYPTTQKQPAPVFAVKRANEKGRAKSDHRVSATTTTTSKMPPRSSTTTEEEENDNSGKFDSYYNMTGNAILSSLPVLMQRFIADSKDLAVTGSQKLWNFILPNWEGYSSSDRAGGGSLPTMKQLIQSASSSASSPMEFMLRHFDTNGDGHISASELLNMTEILKHMPEPPAQISWATWFRREWPLLDWKIGVFLWSTFGGFLFLLAGFSIIPGRMHGISAKILRWPVLAVVNFLIIVELTVYIVIRLFIRIAEYLIARPKHRRLRQRMAQAKSYPEWFAAASELDRSQKRDRWLRQVDDHTSKRYNWGFIRELINDMKRARSKEDPLLALAVLQQCTRKNVGGVMSWDLFSYSNSGEPKQIVREFVEEVVASLHFLTNEASKVPLDDIISEEEMELGSVQKGEQQAYEMLLHKKVREEKTKLWQSLISATLNVFNDKKDGSPGRRGSKHGSLSRSRQASGGNLNGEAAAAKSHGSLSIFHRMEVLLFLKRARAAYGRTALCLSGGAMMGLYHFGHVLGLLEAGVLPTIISGTSGGSVIGAIICTRTDEEIRRDLNPELLVSKLTCFDRPWSERLKSLVREGCLFSFETWMEKIKWFTCGELTFAEAYRKTGRIFCVTLSSTTKKAPPVLLNYLTAPDVTIASAVIASAAVPGFVQPVRLQYKDSKGVVKSQAGETYFDGSIEQDIPVAGLAEMFNCQFFIACQCNPHVVPFFFNSKGGVGRPSRWSSGTQEDSYRGGFLLAALEMYLKNDMKAKFKFLHDLEVAVGFTSSMMVQSFEGSTTIVPQVSFVDYLRLFSDPTLDQLWHYFQAGSVAAYEHTAMIKLHYSLVDVLDDMIEKLQPDSGEKQKTKKRRTHILIPESKSRATIVLAESEQYAVDVLRKSPTNRETAAAHDDRSSTSDSFNYNDDDEDDFERSWVKSPY